MKTKRIYNYFVNIDKAGMVDSIVTGMGTNYKRVYPFKWQKHIGFTQTRNLTFTQLKNGIYKGYITLY